VSLVEAGATMQSQGWRQPVRDMTGFLDANRATLTYALVKHGSSVYGAMSGRSLANDWPPRADFYAPLQLEQQFEDSFAPDAFAVQLLGPGYAGRIPNGPRWRETRLDQDRVILEHVSPELWFGTQFCPFGGRPHYREAAPDPPEVLNDARADFAEILFTDDLVIAQ
jgi:hypothetical protein